MDILTSSQMNQPAFSQMNRPQRNMSIEALSWEDFETNLTELSVIEQKKSIAKARFNNVPVIVKESSRLEFEMHKALSAHDNVATLLPLTCKESKLFGDSERKKCALVVEYAAKGDLMGLLLDQRKPMSESGCKIWVRDILTALVALSDLSIMHRDIKPENIVCAADGKFQLIDFGDARKGPSDRRPSRTYHGTLQYMSPEILARQPHDTSCDIWSLGATLLAALTLQNPYFEIRVHHPDDLTSYERMKMTCGNIDVSDRRLKNVSDSGKEFLRNLLQRDPAKRLTPSEALKHPWLLQASSR